MLGNPEIPADWENKWKANLPFEIYTSGSTGKPKSHLLRPKLIKWSAVQTLKHFINSEDLHQLIALPLNKAGGFMQWARAKTWNSKFDLCLPSSNPLLDYHGKAKLASFTPMQIEGILGNTASKEKLKEFNSILIGGAPISAQMETQLLKEYPHIHWVHTFGMTETYSHFAGRTLGENEYRLVDDTFIDETESGMRVKNPCTQNEWMQTFDRISILPSNRFIWIGRSDNTINSGGIKIQLETVEREIQEQTYWPLHDFFCWYESDAALGQKLVLFVKSHLGQVPRFQFSSKYFQPKNIYILNTFIYATTGKILRKETAENIVK